MWKTMLGLMLVVSVALAGCTSKPSGQGDPKKRLNEYISRTFNIKSVGDRAALMTYLTGEAKNRLAVWSDEQFREVFIDSKREFAKLVFVEAKSVSPKEMNITYELTYVDKAKGSGAKITNKKLCTLVEEQGIWLIKDVRNIKELVEYQNEMSLP